MAVFSSLELIAGEKLAVENQTAAHAGTDEEAYDVFKAFGGTEVIFTQDTEVHVVADVKRNAELLTHGRRHIIITPGKIRRKEYDSLFLIDDAGGTGSHGVQFFLVDAGLLDHLVYHADDDLFHVCGFFTAALGALFQPVNDLVLFVEDRAEHFCAAHIQTDIVTFSHDTSSFSYNSSFIIIWNRTGGGTSRGFHLFWQIRFFSHRQNGCSRQKAPSGQPCAR